MPATTACGEPFPGETDSGASIVTPDPSADAHDGFALAVAPPADPPGVPDPLDPHPAAAAATAAMAPHATSPLFICMSTPRLARTPSQSSEKS